VANTRREDVSRKRDEKVSLHPLTFDEAIDQILKAPPIPKPEKAKGSEQKPKA
jgi:hypothetical protein